VETNTVFVYTLTTHSVIPSLQDMDAQHAVGHVYSGMLSYQFLAFVVVDDVEQWIRRRDVLQQAHVTKAESDFRLRQRKQLCFTKRIQFVACCLEFDFRKKASPTA